MWLPRRAAAWYKFNKLRGQIHTSCGLQWVLDVQTKSAAVHTHFLSEAPNVNRGIYCEIRNRRSFSLLPSLEAPFLPFALAVSAMSVCIRHLFVKASGASERSGISGIWWSKVFWVNGNAKILKLKIPKRYISLCWLRFNQYGWNSTTQSRGDRMGRNHVRGCAVAAASGGGGRKAEREQHCLPALHYLLVNENPPDCLDALKLSYAMLNPITYSNTSTCEIALGLRTMILCDELIFKRLNAWNGACSVKMKKRETGGRNTQSLIIRTLDSSN